MERASEEHGDFAVSVMATMLTGTHRRAILNLPNAGQVDDLPTGTIVETPATIDGRSVSPVPQGAMPVEVSGLVRQVAVHAAMTAEAAVTGDRELAATALAVHPLVRSLNLADALSWLPTSTRTPRPPRSLERPLSAVGRSDLRNAPAVHVAHA